MSQYRSIKRTKNKFIAGAVCPECQDTDSLALYEEQGEEHVECVSCGYQMSEREAELKEKLKAMPQSNELIGFFTPES